MPDMAKACDEFGTYLAKLRAGRKMTSKDLGGAIGKSPSYINGWERYPRPVNKAVLHKVCDALKLGEAERHQLFVLADKRLGLDDRKEQYGRWGQMMLNAAQALGEVEHQIGENVTTQTLSKFHECASWVLAHYAAYSGISVKDYDPYQLAWPSFLRKEKIVSLGHRKAGDLIPIPEDLLTAEFPELNKDTELNEDLARAIGSGMAGVWRKWVLSDLDRCRSIAANMRRWRLSDDVETGPVGTFIFSDIDNQEFNIEDIRVSVIETITQRDLAYHLYGIANARPNGAPFQSIRIKFESVDANVITAVKLAEAYDTCLIGQNAPGARQTILDALYTIDSPAWGWPGILEDRWMIPLIATPGYKKRMADLADIDEVSPDRGFFELEAIYEESKASIIDSLEATLRKMDRQERAQWEAQKRKRKSAGSTSKTTRKTRATKQKRDKAKKKAKGKGRA